MTAADVHIIHHGQSLTWTESVVLLYILRIRVWQWRIEPAEIQFNSPLIANSGKRPRCKVGTLRANYPRRNFQFTRPMRTIFSSRPIYKIRKYVPASWRVYNGILCILLYYHSARRCMSVRKTRNDGNYYCRNTYLPICHGCYYYRHYCFSIRAGGPVAIVGGRYL